MGEFNLSDLLPMPPWEGPPFPRFMQVFWPWASKATSLSLPIPPFLNLPRVAASSSPEVLYQNTEELEVVRDASGSIAKVIRHIRVTKQSDGG